MSAIHQQVDPAIVEARLKYLQRVPFPAPRGDVGRGGRTYYSAEDLMKLVAVFELIAASVLPAQAAALVNERWDVITRGLVRAWNARADNGVSVVMLAAPNTFDVEDAGAGHIEIAAADELALRLRATRISIRRGTAGGRADGSLARHLTLVDLTALALALDAALPTTSGNSEKTAMRGDVETLLSRGSRSIARTGS